MAFRKLINPEGSDVAMDAHSLRFYGQDGHHHHIQNKKVQNSVIKKVKSRRSLKWKSSQLNSPSMITIFYNLGDTGDVLNLTFFNFAAKDAISI